MKLGEALALNYLAESRVLWNEEFAGPPFFPRPEVITLANHLTFRGDQAASANARDQRQTANGDQPASRAQLGGEAVTAASSRRRAPCKRQ